MSAELRKLAHLQEMEQQISALQARIAEYPRKVAAREAAVAGTLREIEQAIAALDRQAAARRRMESDIADQRMKESRYRAQLDAAATDAQARALEHQIAFCRQEIDRIEELEFQSLVETEALEARQRLLDETAANQRLASEQEAAAAQLALARDQAEQLRLNGERTGARAEIEPALLAEYDRISAAKKNAVAHVEQQRCSVCQMMVRPQRWNEIRQGAVHVCESCGRFLFYDPAVDLTDAIYLPPAKKPAGAAARPPAAASAQEE